MTHLKCAFGFSSGKFLGFIVHSKRIDLDPAKAKEIQDMEPPKIVKQLKSFIGRVSYIRRFISVLAELIEPFHKLLKKISFEWSKEQVAIQKVEDIVSSHQRMISPVKGLPLTLYLTAQ